MSLIDVSVKHGKSRAEARDHLEMAVKDVCTRFGSLVNRVDWSHEREQVKLLGPGVEVQMRVDDEHVHISGDMPLLGKLMGSPLLQGIKGIVQNTFQPRLGKSDATK